MSGAELLARGLAAALAAQPLAVAEMGAGQLGGHPALPEPLDRLAVVLLGGPPGADQCA